MKIMKKIIILFLLLLLTGNFSLFAQNFKIVILPFDKLNKGKNSELETLSKGISETLAGALSTVDNFIIIDTYRVKRYLLDNAAFNQAIGTDAEKNLEKLRQLAQTDLDSDYVIYGSFYKIGKQIKLDAKCLTVDSGKIEKAASVHGAYPDKIFDLQEDLAKKLTIAINGLVNPNQKKIIESYTNSTGDYTAYKFYIKGRMEHLKYSSHNYPLAIKYYKQAVQVDPNYALAWAGMSEVNALWAYQIQYAGGLYKPKLQEAIKQGGKSVELGNNLYQTHRALSVAYMTNSDFKNARKAIKPAYKLSQNDAEILWVKAQLSNYGYKEMGKTGTEAYKYITRSLSINPDLIVARWSLAHSLYTLKKYDDSIREFKKILQLNPAHSPSLYTISLMNYNQKAYDISLEYAKRAVEVAPHIPQNHYMLGLCYYKLKDWENSEKALKGAIKIKPDDTDAIYTLAGTYYNRKMYREAMDTYSKVLKIDPKYSNAKHWMEQSEKKIQK